MFPFGTQAEDGTRVNFLIHEFPLPPPRSRSLILHPPFLAHLSSRLLFTFSLCSKRLRENFLIRFGKGDGEILHVYAYAPRLSSHYYTSIYLSC